MITLWLWLAVLLPVPFVPQDTDTCGAAALAMVLRYWQHPVPHDEIAATLLERNLEGIRGSQLADFVRAQGLYAVAYSGDVAQLREQIKKGRPVIVALRLKGGRFHDVVVVGVDEAKQVVKVHDPARGPRRSMPVRSFEEGWAAAGHWALLVLPDQHSE
jgi:ABC-type bacteriocin/lantibiotic exporter with double-glycine peptidase domain